MYHFLKLENKSYRSRKMSSSLKSSLSFLKLGDWRSDCKSLVEVIFSTSGNWKIISRGQNSQKMNTALSNVLCSHGLSSGLDLKVWEWESRLIPQIYLVIECSHSWEVWNESLSRCCCGRERESERTSRVFIASLLHSSLLASVIVPCTSAKMFEKTICTS